MIRINKELLECIVKINGTDPSITVEKFTPKDIVLKAGKMPRAVYIVKDGILKCYQSEDTGADFIQEFFGEGEIFGEVEVFNDDISFCTIEAVGAVKVYKIPGNTFVKLIEENKKFNRLVLNAMASKIKYKALRHAHNQSHALEANLIRLREQFPDLYNAIAKKDIASYLGITERSLNRALNTLK